MKPITLMILSLIALILTLIYSIQINTCNQDISIIKNILLEWQLDE